MKQLTDIQMKNNIISISLLNEEKSSVLFAISINVASEGITQDQLNLFEQFVEEYAFLLEEISRSVAPEEGMIMFLCSKHNIAIQTHDIREVLKALRSLVVQDKFTR